MILRPYQQAAVDAVLARFDAGEQRTLIVKATGTGKTVTAGHVAKLLRAATGKRVMALAHRDELIRQTVDKWSAITGIIPAVEKAGERSDEDSMHGAPPIVVSSFQTLNSGDERRRRMHRFNPHDFGLIWVDEAHHSTAESFRRVIEYMASGGAKVLGVTATADRADGEALGQVYQSVAYTYELPNAIRDGYLVPIRQRSVVIEGLDFSKVRTTAGDLNAQDLEAAMMYEKPLHGVAHATVETACGLAQHCLAGIKDEPDRGERVAAMLVGKRRRKSLVFCVTVAHAERLAEILNRWLPGSALHVDGTMNADRRRGIFREFKRGDIQFLTACMVPTEGFDEPGIEIVVMARPTKSRPLFAQMVGRGTRPLDDIAPLLGNLADAAARRQAIADSPKTYLEVLDFVGNTGRHKLVTTADLLGDERYDPAVIERAKELAEVDVVDVEEALQRAEAEAEEEAEVGLVRAEIAAEELEAADAERERERQATAARRAALVGTAEYSVSESDPFDRHATSPRREHAAPDRGGATDKQVDLLVGLGVTRETAERYGRRQASAVIDSLGAKRCTVRQANVLRRAGYAQAEIDAFNVAMARAEIDLLAANGWRREAVV